MTQRTPFTCLSLTVYIVSCCGNNYSDLPTYPYHTHLWCTTHLNVEKNSYKEWENAATCRKYLVQLNSTSQHVACKRRGIFSYSLVPSRGMGKIRLHSLHLGCCFYCCKVKDMFMCVFCLLYHEKRKSKSGSGNGVHDRFVPPPPHLTSEHLWWGTTILTLLTQHIPKLRHLRCFRFCYFHFLFVFFIAL